ncbi:iron-containing alcohol dehydrogenase family protein [Clostridium cellulovorans]|nr:iron-containing alcohol dehydrogenase family protein [Clostridium cellulovorans]
MSTKVVYGENVINNNGELIASLGKKALLVTGKNSAKISGAYKDVTDILNKHKIEYCIFDQVEENPSTETILIGEEIGKLENIDFIIAIGGGSPLDAAKAISLMVKSKCSIDDIFTKKNLPFYPVIAIPTTAGTGSEVTPYAIIIDERAGTKKGIATPVFPQIAFLDVKYTISLSEKVTIDTAVDALSHIIEGYLTSRANIFSDALGEKALSLFKECKEELKVGAFTKEVREKLLLASNFAGMQIAQSGTSVPHLLGYQLTVHKGIAHGRANGILMTEYLKLYKNNFKVLKLLKILDFNSIEEFKIYLNELLSAHTESIEITLGDIKQFTERAYKVVVNRNELKELVTKDQIFDLYKNSLKI